MRKRLIDAFRMMIPLGPKWQRDIATLSPYLTQKELTDVRYLARLRRVGFHSERLATSSAVFPDRQWSQLTLAVEDEDLHRFVERVNAKVHDAVLLESFTQFRAVALDRITGLVAPQLVGLDIAKQAAALQLFCQEPIHILLLGDPGTGKTEILRSIGRLAPHAVFGLGSGASKAGLVGMYEGREFHPGLLVQADQGIALIDELNLMKKEDLAGLYSAMEKGFVTYDKRGKHERHDALIRVLATGNPKGDRFVAIDIHSLKAQLPFEEALLSRFHLLFVVRKPTPARFEQIARRIAKQEVVDLPDGDARFVQEYVRHAEKLAVAFDSKYESMVVDFVEGLKRDEKRFLVEVSPRLVIGLIRMAKGFARARLARNTSADDIEGAMRLMKDALTNLS
jgi:DNA replicative helicase MCM subunit Mcm2 (Cdc46/Mcm family)